MPTKLPTLKELFDSGVHLGHKKEYTHPGSKKYIYLIKNKINIIDLEKTVEELKKALDYLQKVIKSGKIVLFVGTKRQIRDIVKESATKIGMPFIVERWWGGTLTNFDTILKKLYHLNELEKKTQSEEFKNLTKKERSQLEKEKEKLSISLEGLRNMKKVPDILFIVDTFGEKVAVEEARKLEIPIVGICDTNANPGLIDWPIPANDEAQKSIAIIMETISEALKDSRKSEINESPKVPPSFEEESGSRPESVEEDKKEKTKSLDPTEVQDNKEPKEEISDKK